MHLGRTKAEMITMNVDLNLCATVWIVFPQLMVSLSF